MEANDVPELRSLAAGIRRDLAAVPAPSRVTRIKGIKRDGYGRAKFDLIRAQILLAT